MTAAANSVPKKDEPLGIIPLGNTGVGKSYISNMLIGRDQFASKFQAKAATIRTGYYEIPQQGSNPVRIYDVPGLVELDQEKINQNIEEIKKTFKQTPRSLVMFVWAGQIGGRPQSNDMIAFEALYKAYQFPESSIIHVINGVLKKEVTDDFVASFVQMLAKAYEFSLKGTSAKIQLPLRDFFLMEHIESGDNGHKVEMQKKLICFIDKHSMLEQKEIIPLQLTVAEVREGVKKFQSADICKPTPSFWESLWKDVTNAMNKITDGVINIFVGVTYLMGYAVIITGAGIQLVTVATVSPAVLVGNLVAGGIGRLLSSK